MKKKIVLGMVAKIYGGLITLLLLFAFAPKLFGSWDTIGSIPSGIMNWYDNPTGFFITYIIGYIIVWFRPLWGACVMGFGVLLFFAINATNIPFLVLFLLPVLSVAVLYLIYWNVSKKATDD